MAAIIRLESISLSFGEAPLLDKVQLQIYPKERIFLVGRNGMGKSCLLKVILGQYSADDGKILRIPDLKIAELPQNLPDFGDKTVYEVVADGLAEIGDLLKRYHHLSQNYSEENADLWLKQIEDIQKQLEAKEGWQYSQMIDKMLTELDLPADYPIKNLSGGWQRRALLAASLVSCPDLLLLDEPTNHLDLAVIEWLEEYLLNFKGALLCVTHDRTLLRKLSQRILELDRGNLTSWQGSYDQYVVDREHRLEVEAKQAKLFDTVLAKEEAWIRQGIKARRTRNEGRVRALKKLRQERKQRRELQNKPGFKTNEVLQSGDLMIKAENICYSIDNKTIIKDFSCKIFRGDKIALIGPNGIGKSTLLKILLTELSPTQGNVALGTRCLIGYFDQLRQGLNFSLSAEENVAGGREFIMVNGQEKHVISYLSEFLFTPARARTPVQFLSGGECNRLLLAKLFSLPVNLLVLDEPTNDLDIESLELLEEILINYTGTLLLVSHDRSFIDAVATNSYYFSGFGKINEYVGGYSDIPASIINKNENKNNSKTFENVLNDSQSRCNDNVVRSVEMKKTNSNKIVSNKFSSKLQRELNEIPGKIATLELQQTQIQNEIAASNFYHQEKNKIARTLEALKEIESKLHNLYERWEVLENLKENN